MWAEESRWSIALLTSVSRRETVPLSSASTILTSSGTSNSLGRGSSSLWTFWFFEMGMEKKKKDSLSYWIWKTNLSIWTSQQLILDTQPCTSVQQVHSVLQARPACTLTWKRPGDKYIFPCWDQEFPVFYAYYTDVLKHLEILFLKHTTSAWAS